VKKFIFAPLKIIKAILSSLTPLAIVGSIVVVIGSSLIIYDQVRTYKERGLGAKLIKNLEVESSCKQIVNAEGKFNLEFNFKNKNPQTIALKEIQTDKGLVGTGGKEFLNIISTSPAFEKTDATQPDKITYQFSQVVAPSNGDLKITLSLKAKSREEAKAESHTIVIYTGSLFFDFEHEITIEVPCEIQVRYAD